MLVKFWGVRGSLPSPLVSDKVAGKFFEIFEKLCPSDLESPDSKKRFLKELPSRLYGTVGGNTACVSVQLKDSHEVLVLDAGSGIREMGISFGNLDPKLTRYHILFSHFHWDHLMGLPFFAPAYDPSVTLDFYSPFSGIEKTLNDQMMPPYFPIQMETMASKKNFHTISGPLELLGAKISYRKMNHPGDSFSYKVEYEAKKFIYATDTELLPEDFLKTDENSAFFSGADLIVVDSQYTIGEAIEKYNWGHNSYSMAVDFAANWGIKHLVLFHHDPGYDDEMLFSILQSARSYTERMNIKGINISLAIEGTEITL